MNKLDNINLEKYGFYFQRYFKEDVEDVEDIYPNLFEMTTDELYKFSQALYNEASRHYESCLRYERHAETIKNIAKILEDNERKEEKN